MPKSRNDILKDIANHALKHHFAGTKEVLPKVGDKVRVLRGESVGAEYEVLAVVGNVYSSSQRVYVAAPQETPTWYYPWDLQVLPSEDD